jgi:hypothetical protein
MANELDISVWLDQDPGRLIEVDKWIIKAALRDYDFWLKCSEKVCVDPTGSGMDLRDFNDYKHNVIFIGLKKFFNVITGSLTASGTFTVPDPTLFIEFLRQEAKQGHLCSEAELDGIATEYVALLGDSGNYAAAANRALPFWLTRKRAQYIASGRDLTLEKLMRAVEQHADVVSTVSDNSESIVFYGEHPRNRDASGQIMLSDLSGLSRAIGGFFAGDAYMFQSPSGGGKTVMACQLLVEFVKAHLDVVFISTEQPWKEIEPRILASSCNIPIDRPYLINRFDYFGAKAYKAEMARIVAWEAMAAKHFLFVRWNTDNSQSVRTDLEATIRLATAKFGKKPKVVILDWVGGALGDNVDAANLRFAYQAAADAFASAADKHQFIGIATAQSKNDRNYRALSAEQLAENKSMHRKFTTLVGITAIVENEEESKLDPNNRRCRAEQWLDISKARKGMEMRIRVRRQFDMQKFVELTSSKGVPLAAPPIAPAAVP